jgi:WD40 repeat protein
VRNYHSSCGSISISFIFFPQKALLQKMESGVHVDSEAGASVCSVGDVFAICGQGDQYGVWDVVAGTQLWTTNVSGKVTSCCFSSTANKFVVISHHVRGTQVKVTVWDLVPDEIVLSLTGSMQWDFFSDFNQYGTRLLSWNYGLNEGICIRDVSLGTILFTLVREGCWPSFVGSIGCTLAYVRAKSVHVLDTDAGKEIAFFESGFRDVRRPLPSSDGRLCALYSQDSIGLWETDPGHQIFCVKGVEVRGICYDGNNELLVACLRRTGYQHFLTCWSVADGSVFFEVPTDCKTFCSLTFSPQRNSFHVANSAASCVHEIDSSNGAEVSRSTLNGIRSLHTALAVTILL